MTAKLSPYNFEGAKISSINLSEREDIIDLNFAYATIKGNALYNKATFKGLAKFDGATFEETARFYRATVEDDLRSPRKILAQKREENQRR
jgi:uncharacterized protein YjbI with pentapeptide repeats